MASRGPSVKKAAFGAAIAGGVISAAKLEWDRRSSGKDPRRFRLAEGEPVSEGLARVALGQLDTAIARLESRSDGGPSEEAVHEARKSFKRLRAILRLARDELGDKTYGRENRLFRDAGRRLAGARDAQVLLDTLDATTRRYPELGPPTRFTGLRETLVAEHTMAEQELRDSGVTDEVARQLDGARKRVSTWPLDGDDFESLEPSFRRIYRRARRAYRRARRTPSTENLHELRKRTKDLWYCSQILGPASPKRMKRIAQDAHELSDLLGEEHDLAILDERIAARRKKLLQDARPIARRLFRKKPRKVARLPTGPAG